MRKEKLWNSYFIIVGIIGLGAFVFGIFVIVKIVNWLTSQTI